MDTPFGNLHIIPALEPVVKNEEHIKHIRTADRIPDVGDIYFYRAVCAEKAHRLPLPGKPVIIGELSSYSEFRMTRALSGEQG
jgi:hypothetical protein